MVRAGVKDPQLVDEYFQARNKYFSGLLSDSLDLRLGELMSGSVNFIYLIVISSKYLAKFSVMVG